MRLRNHLGGLEQGKEKGVNPDKITSVAGALVDSDPHTHSFAYNY